MKIAFVCPDGLSVVLFCKEIIKKLSDLPDDSVFVLTDIGKYREEIEAQGSSCIQVDYNRFFNVSRDFQYFLSLYEIFKEQDFDIVFNFSTKSNIYGSIAAKLAKRKMIYSHVVGLGAGFFYSEQRGIKKWVYWAFIKMYRIAFRSCRKIWFTNRNDVSFFLAQRMIDESKVVLTRNYLDTNRYKPIGKHTKEVAKLQKEINLEPNEKVVVMVARMIWPKGIKEFAEASILLKDRLPMLRFFLIAPLEDDSDDSVPESYIKDIELKSNLQWFGFREDVISFYALADLAVLPTYYKEGGYPRALLEPMSMGKPVIASDSEDCRGAVEHGKNGYLVPVKDSKTLADTIENLIKDEERREVMGEESRKKAVAEFDEKVIVSHALSELGIIDSAN